MENKIKRVLIRTVFVLMVAAVFGLAAPGDARAAIIDVPADYPTIQAAIDVAVSGDTPVEISGDGPAEVSYSDIEGGYAGWGNINSGPLFADADLRLSPGSPCIDAGCSYT